MKAFYSLLKYKIKLLNINVSDFFFSKWRRRHTKTLILFSYDLSPARKQLQISRSHYYKQFLFFFMKVKLPSALSTSSHSYSFGDVTKFPKCCFESYKASHFVTILLWLLLYGSHGYFCCFMEEWERRASGNHIIPLTWLSVPGQDNMSIVQNGGPSNMFCNRSEVKSANLFRQKCYFSQDI